MNDAQLTFERQARSVFERSLATLDADTRARLRHARVKALDSLDPPRSAAYLRRPAPWIAACAAAVAAISFAWLLPQSDPGPQPALQLATSPDSDLLLGNEALDMLENLQFYSWLDEQAHQKSAGGNGGIG
ncbi:MAG TPA: hypothetical protein VFY39_05655 [Gammaproteobacteria bacterium]|nr:hypothetical protein [Gammaproteobacteria bacterium]